MDVYENLKKNDITLPSPCEDTPTLRMARRFGGNFVFISGMGPVLSGKQTHAGLIPSEVSVAEGQVAAKHCALNILAALEKELGDLNKVKSIVKLLVYVASDAGFGEQHIVANGASDVFMKAFGEEIGKSSRSAIGVAGLPMHFSVEIEAIAEICE